MPLKCGVGNKKSLYIYIWRDPEDKRGVFANANINQDELNAWLNIQEQNNFYRVDYTNEIVREFDELHVDPYDYGVPGEQGRGAGIRRTKIWRFNRGLTKPLWRQMLSKIKYNVQTRQNKPSVCLCVAKH